MSRKSAATPTPATFAVATWLASKTPDWLLYYAAKVAGGAHYWLAAEKRRSYLENTRAAEFSGGQRPWHAFQNQTLNVLELLKSVRTPDERLAERVALHGTEHIDRALKKGRGIVLVTFHSGNWELSVLLLALRGYPITPIAGEQLNKAWSDSVKARKERLGIKVLSPNAAVRELYRDLAANRAVALHIDGDLFAGGIEARLLGKNVAVPRGPARLSHAMSAPLALAYCRRDGRGLHLHVEPPYPPAASRADEETLTRTLVARVEKCILEDPSQWCVFRRL